MGIHASQNYHYSTATAIPKGEELEKSLSEEFELGLGKVRESDRSLQGNLSPVFVSVVQIVIKPPDSLLDVKEFTPEEAQPKVVVVDCVVVTGIAAMFRFGGGTAVGGLVLSVSLSFELLLLIQQEVVGKTF